MRERTCRTDITLFSILLIPFGSLNCKSATFFFVSAAFTWMQSQPFLPSRTGWCVVGAYTPSVFSSPCSVRWSKCGGWSSQSGVPPAVSWVRHFLIPLLFWVNCCYPNLWSLPFAPPVLLSSLPPVAFLSCCSIVIPLKPVKAQWRPGCYKSDEEEDRSQPKGFR